MKKYLNKGLLYAWFNSAKAPIMIGILVWGLFAYKIIKSGLSSVKNELAHNFNNYFYTTNLYEYLMLGIIFIAIYSIAKGINKRNTEMFLCSSPYTKKQIRYNELICLLITLMLFVATYVYIAIMSYIGNKEFIAIVEGYWSIIIIEILKIILLGIIGIMFMLIMDSMFSNSVIGFISMISIIPISIAMIISKIGSILEYFGVGDNYSLLDKITGVNPNEEFRRDTVSILLERTTVKEVTVRGVLFEIVVVIFIIAIMIIIYNAVQRKYKLENSNKIFSSRINENVIVILIATAIGSFISLVFVQDFIRMMQQKTGQYAPLLGLDLVKCLSVDIICIGIVGFIAYKIMKKVLKNII